MNNKKLIAQALAGVIALGLSSAATTAMAGTKGDMEKCYGVSKAKMNDCGTSAHSCAAQAPTDGAKTDWIFVPTGTCNKLVGGSTSSGEKTDN